MEMIRSVFGSVISIAVVATLFTGCGYWTDRVRDTADILTFGLERSLWGAKGQIGPFGQLGMYCAGHTPVGRPDGFGLAGGQFQSYTFEDCTVPPLVGFVQARRTVVDNRRKDFHVLSVVWCPVLHPQTGSPSPSFFGGFEGADDWRRLAPRYTQVEIAAGLVYGLRVGFNPGELLDWLVGWFGGDLYADDVGVLDACGDVGDASLEKSDHE